MYLSGCIPTALLNHPRPDLGVMMQPGGDGANSKILDWVPWAADNGCFAQGERFDPGAWLEWLASVRRFRGRCLFAVLPDVVGDPVRTWERSLPALQAVDLLGFPPAYVSQDGETRWPDGARCLFIGGSDRWKLSEESYELAAKAKAAGLWVHMGRVNSLRRLMAARLSAIDSADGTYVKFGPDRNLPRVYDWLDAVNGQRSLMEVEAA